MTPLNWKIVTSSLATFGAVTFVAIGLVESFVYGVYAGLVFTPIYNFMLRACGSAVTARPAGR